MYHVHNSTYAYIKIHIQLYSALTKAYFDYYEKNILLLNQGDKIKLQKTIIIFLSLVNILTIINLFLIFPVKTSFNWVKATFVASKHCPRRSG